MGTQAREDTGRIEKLLRSMGRREETAGNEAVMGRDNWFIVGGTQ